MKKLQIAIITLLMSISSFSQITFEKGYFIDTSGNKTECFIKNIEWLQNPSEFHYKNSPESLNIINASTDSIVEFAIYDQVKYLSRNVKIDRSGENIDRDYSRSRSPEFNTEALFLKVLIEGNANLYYFKDSKNQRFFFSKNDLPIEQLIYKEYWNNEGKIGTNNYYKQQLINNLNCESISKSRFENLKYFQNELEDIISEYNACNQTVANKKSTIYKKEKTDKFNLTIRPGVSFQSLKTTEIISRDKIDFGSQTNFKLGIEAEFILPFNKNKWAIIVEPRYQSLYNGEEETQIESSTRITTTTVNYKSVEIPIGLRYYMFLNKNSKLFVNVAYVFDFPIDSSIERTVRTLNIDIETQGYVALGIGYKYLNKYSLELNYGLNRNLFNSTYYDTDYKSISLMFGYTLF